MPSGMPRPSEAAGPLLTFRAESEESLDGTRFGGQHLSAREAGLERVPPPDPRLPSLPAQISDLVPDPGREVDEAAVDILEFADVRVDLVDVGLDGSLKIL